MNKLCLLTVCASALWQMPPLAAAPVLSTDGSASRAEISASLATPSPSSDYARTFMTTDTLDVGFTLTIDPVDRGQLRKLYLVAVYSGHWFMLDSDHHWQGWNGDLADLVSFDERVLAAAEPVQVLDRQSLFGGEYLIYAGYANRSGGIIYTAAPLSFYVFEPEDAALKSFYSKDMLEQYLQQSLQRQYDQPWAFPISAPTAGATDASNDAEFAKTSTTNVQETGVDEADSIKTDNNQLYALSSCDSSQSANCIKHYQLSDNPAAATLLDSTRVAEDVAAESLYLSNERIDQAATLITIGSHQNNMYKIMPAFDSISIWPNPGIWQQPRTDAVFYHITEPGLTQTHHIRLDGSLVSSRRIDGTLYLVTRSTPSAEQLMPSINIDGVKHTLTEAQNCYLPPSSAAQYPEASIITLTAVAVDEPTRFSSRCIVGQTETIYMSPKNLYLATTRYPYSVFEPGLAENTMIRYQPEQTTQLHKFALDGLTADYRGSGEVKGHLGWEEDKKSFRMGEHNETLRIATSLGETWDGNTSTSVTLLQDQNQSLREVGRLDNLGKPGERLYAARFMGDRGFLVTFRLIDPLYILDLSDPSQPKVTGELEINGYSDYLHPIGENFLLGIGKDAIADNNAPDNGGRGAWYQGVKLSLFDISNPAAPREVDQLVLGKRGSESDALYDHHALAYLPPQAGTPARLALPLRLHDGAIIAGNSGSDAYYQWLSTGLHVFDIDIASATPSIKNAGQIITEQAPAQDETYFSWSDRAVLHGQSAHYIHGGAVYSAHFD